jgi:CubicO group peptidase (beta-lactamase class C family)
MLVGVLVILGVMVLAVSPFILLAPRAPRIPSGPSSVAQVEAYARALTDHETPPALEILVTKVGQVVYHKAFGMADGPSGRPASVDDIYHLWSVTKLFTATAILQLAEDGRLSLDDPVQKYLPRFVPISRSGKPVPITVRQLLNHTSGMRNLAPTHLMGWIHHLDDPPVSQSALVAERMQAYATLVRNPGQRGAYSNAGYVVLGAVVEAAAGQPYEDFVRDRILRPLAMTGTDFTYRKDQIARSVTGTHPLFHFFTLMLILLHRDWFSRWVKRIQRLRMWLVPLYTDYTGPTGLIGTATDLARFGQAFLAGGALGDCQLLRMEAAHEMLDEGYGASAGPGGDRMGLGWHWWCDAPMPFKGHGGEGPGFAAQLALFQKQQMVIVILANDTLIDRVALTNLVAAAFK